MVCINVSLSFARTIMMIIVLPTQGSLSDLEFPVCGATPSWESDNRNSSLGFKHQPLPPDKLNGYSTPYPGVCRCRPTWPQGNHVRMSKIMRLLIRTGGMIAGGCFLTAVVVDP